MIGDRLRGYEHPRRLDGEASARREVAKLRAALGRAINAGDKRSTKYLTRRLATAVQVVQARGWRAAIGWDEQ